MNVHKRAGISVLFIAFLWFGPGYSQACMVDSDCAPGESCHDYTCLTGSGTSCANDGECTIAGEVCYLGRCRVVQCRAHCDCPQGSFCYYGKCVTDPKTPVYCCANPGCPPGRWCFEPTGGKGTCAEQPDYVCQSACDCGPAHCCKYDAMLGHNVCVKDQADPWSPGPGIGWSSGLSCEQGVDPTYCCQDPICHAGRHAYGSNAANFSCYDPAEKIFSNFCSGAPCFSACDCDPGESCVDTHVTGTVLPVGAICSSKRGSCVSNAVGEAVYGYSPVELIPCCGKGCLTGQTCELTWKTSGVYLVERVVTKCGDLCGNGICDPLESHRTCPEDCKYCTLEGPDGRCEPEEIVMHYCQADCGYCGDGNCSGWKTPKNCPQDCKQPVCGDGSCDPSEVTTCPQDCGCPDSPKYLDYPSFCGDGYCDPNPSSLKNCVTCPQDCGAICPQPIVAKDAKTSLKRTYHWSINKTADQSSLTLTLNQSFPVNYAVSVDETSSDSDWSVAGNISIHNPASLSTVIKSVSDEVSGVGAAAVDCGMTFPYTLTSQATLTCAYSAGLPDASPRTNIVTVATPTIGGVSSVSGTANIDFSDATISAIDSCVSVTDDKKGGLGTVCNTNAPKTFTYSLSPGPFTSVGTYTFMNTASLKTDTTNTTGSSSWTVNVNVRYSFTGFLQPVDDPPVMNTAKAGQTLPVKWQLPEGKGGFISDLGAVTNITYQQVQCSNLSDAMTSEVAETASGSSGLHYDTTANQFVYNWNTTKSMAGNCYVLTLKLNDGSQYQADFSLK